MGSLAVKETRHFCQNVEGAIKNWTKSYWEHVAKENGISVAETQGFFFRCQREGKRVVPIGECDNFDFQTGCKGHIESALVTPEIIENPPRAEHGERSERDNMQGEVRS